jgi:hypothetical protein
MGLLEDPETEKRNVSTTCISGNFKITMVFNKAAKEDSLMKTEDNTSGGPSGIPQLQLMPEAAVPSIDLQALRLKDTGKKSMYNSH